MRIRASSGLMFCTTESCWFPDRLQPSAASRRIALQGSMWEHSYQHRELHDYTTTRLHDGTKARRHYEKKDAYPYLPYNRKCISVVPLCRRAVAFRRRRIREPANGFYFFSRVCHFYELRRKHPEPTCGYCKIIAMKQTRRCITCTAL